MPRRDYWLILTLSGFLEKFLALVFNRKIEVCDLRVYPPIVRVSSLSLMDYCDSKVFKPRPEGELLSCRRKVVWSIPPPDATDLKSIVFCLEKSSILRSDRVVSILKTSTLLGDFLSKNESLISFVRNVLFLPVMGRKLPLLNSCGIVCIGRPDMRLGLAMVLSWASMLVWGARVVPTT